MTSTIHPCTSIIIICQSTILYANRYTLLRFLKARQWEIPKATKFFRANIEWRLSEKTDSLLDFKFQELSQVMPYYPHCYHKSDKYGRPVYIEQHGQLNCSKILKVTSERRLLDYHTFTWERFHKQLMPACSALAGKKILATTVILDLEGVGLTSFDSTTRSLLKHLSHVDQHYYPESLGVMFIINTPFIFKTIWAFISPMLEERTRKKIHVLGSDYKAQLLHMIPAENLPRCYGGTSELPSPLRTVGEWMECETFKVKPWDPV